MKFIIAALGDNNVLGKNNTLLWKQKADMQRFRQLTTGKTVIMGRKTFDSIGKPLPNRNNIVITRNSTWRHPGAITTPSLQHALEAAERFNTDIYIIGGAEIYTLALPHIDELHITRVRCSKSGDAFFPEIRDHEWRLVDEEPHSPDIENEFPYIFRKYVRKSSGL
jgi:dihydrofolate reductase